MKRNDLQNLRAKEASELLAQATALRKEYMVALMQFKVGKLPNVKLLSGLRKKLAVVLTLISEKQKMHA